MRELEKKADKYAYEVYSTRPLGDDPTDDEIKEAYIQGYKDAMAWHYPSRGEYPKDDEEVLCLLFSGSPYVGFWDKEDNLWYFAEFYEEEIKCWQYIIPPKEEI